MNDFICRTSQMGQQKIVQPYESILAMKESGAPDFPQDPLKDKDGRLWKTK